MSNVTQEEVIVNEVIHPQVQKIDLDKYNYLGMKSVPCSCCPKTRIFVSHDSCSACFYSVIFCLFVPITSFNIIAFPKINGLKWKLISFLIGDFILVITLLSYFDILTKNPGYEDPNTNNLSKSEFVKKNPEVIIKGKVFKLKYCDTCHIVRQLRTSHCKYCRKCVLVHDHHCTYVNNCIGKKNRINFLIFLICVDFYCLFCCVFSIIFAVKKKKIHIIILIYIIIIGLIGGGLLFSMVPFTVQHLIYISKNKTTREDLKNYHYNNVLNNGCCKNWKEACCNEK